MTRPSVGPAFALLAGLALLGCDAEMPPQITECDQLVLESPDDIATFLTLNTGLTCDFAPPEGDARYACTLGPALTVCGMPSDITLAGCNCISGSVECFERQEEADQLNEMCGS